MSNRSNKIVALLAVAATLALIPASAALVRDSAQDRQAMAVLRPARTWEIRDAQVLASDMYIAERGFTDALEQELRLVVFVSDGSETEGVLRLWDSLKTESLFKRVGMSMFVAGVGQGHTPENMPPNVALSRIRDPEEFSTRTGILALPFSLILASGGNVVAAGFGLPDASFIREAAERFTQEGPSTATIFRPMTPDIKLGEQYT